MYENIKRVCAELGISVTQLEKETGLVGIRRWDQNIPSVDKVQKVAAFLGVSIDYLVTGKDAAAKQPETKTPELPPEVLEATLKLIEALKK